MAREKSAAGTVHPIPKCSFGNFEPGIVFTCRPTPGRLARRSHRLRCPPPPELRICSRFAKAALVTSYQDERTRNAALNGGALAFLGKPVNIVSLIGCLESVLARPS